MFIVEMIGGGPERRCDGCLGVADFVVVQVKHGRSHLGSRTVEIPSRPDEFARCQKCLGATLLRKGEEAANEQVSADEIFERFVSGNYLRRRQHGGRSNHLIGLNGRAQLTLCRVVRKNHLYKDESPGLPYCKPCERAARRIMRG